MADPVPKKTVFVFVSMLTGVQTTPPPMMRERLRQLVPGGGIVQNGFAQAGFRSEVRNAMTKPRTPYSEPAAPKITLWAAHIGALVSE